MYHGLWSNQADMTSEFNIQASALSGFTVITARKWNAGGISYYYVLLRDGNNYPYQVQGEGANLDGKWLLEEIKIGDIQYRLEIATLNNFFSGSEGAMLTDMKNWIESLV